MRLDGDVTPELIPAVVMRVPSGLMLGFIVGVTPPEVVMKVPSGLILGFVVDVPPPEVIMKVPSGVMLGFIVGVIPPCGVVINVPSGLILGFVVGLIVGVVLGLVPGPPGPKPGEVGELELEGVLEEEVWAELLSLPPHPVIVIEAHKRHRHPTRVDNHLAIMALDYTNVPT